MKTRTPGLPGANWEEEEWERCPGLLRLPEDHPAGEITRTARLATFAAHIPERNILSRQDSRVTAPDSVSDAFVLGEFHQAPNSLPPI